MIKNNVFTISSLLLLIVIFFAACTNFTGNQEHAPHESSVNMDWLADLPLDSLVKVVETGTDAQKMVATERMGKIYSVMGNMDTSLYYYRESLSLAEKIADEEHLARLLLDVSYIQLHVLEYESALNNALKALEYYEKTEEYRATLSAYHKIATIFEATGNQTKQKEYLYKALDILDKADGNEEKGKILMSLALYHTRNKNFEEGEKFGVQAIEILREAEEGSAFVLGQTLYRMAMILIIQDKLDEGLAYLNEAVSIAEEIQNIPLKTNLLIAKTNLLTRTEDFQAAMNTIKQAESLIDTTNQLDMNMLYYYLTACAVYVGKTEEAVEYFVKYDRSKDKLQDQIMSGKVSEMEILFETAKKELEIEQQKQVIANQKLQHRFYAAGIAVCILIVSLLWYLFRQRNRLNRSLKEKNDALADMNATKDKFFNIISHDLKNPVLAHRDALQALIDNSMLWNTETVTEYYKKLLKSAENQVILLYNLLDWARLQTGRIAFTPTSFNLPVNLRNVITITSEIAEKKGVIFTVEMPENAIVTGDINMLNTIIRNLLTNAVKFTAAKGTVTLEIKEIKGYADKEIKQYIISVNDDGVGMTPEQLHNLFRIDSAHSQQGTAGEQGSGLGLIICREFLEKHNSELHVESEEGKGSRFWFKINI